MSARCPTFTRTTDMIDMKLYRRAMKAAARQGFDPYNSHDVQSCKWQQLFARDASRKAEKEAKRTSWIPEFLRGI